MMTFAEFQATGRAVDDLVAATDDDGLRYSREADSPPARGRVYCDSLWIEERPESGWPNGRGERWWCLIGRDDWLTDDLAAVERRLYAFACDEGYCGEVVDLLTQLIAVYEAYARAQGLNLGSADEMLYAGEDLDGKPLSEAQRAWLGAFSALWELSE